MTRGRTLMALISAGLLAACGPGDASRSGTDAALAEWMVDGRSELDIESMTATPSGLRYRDVTTGEGAAVTTGNRATVHYTGWLTNGEQFDTSRGGDGFTFVPGQGSVIEGWEEGVLGMRPGGQRILVIPSELGYGERGAGGQIPPNATLVFSIELIEVN